MSPLTPSPCYGLGPVEFCYKYLQIVFRFMVHCFAMFSFFNWFVAKVQVLEVAGKTVKIEHFTIRNQKWQQNGKNRTFSIRSQTGFSEGAQAKPTNWKRAQKPSCSLRKMLNRSRLYNWIFSTQPNRNSFGFLGKLLD